MISIFSPEFTILLFVILNKNEKIVNLDQKCMLLDMTKWYGSTIIMIFIVEILCDVVYKVLTV